MDSSSSLTPPPALLPLNTVLEGWRVVAWAGCGVHGAVYRAVSALDELASPVALKLALHPSNPRFAREAELLSRCLHPSIPRLLDRGSWQSPAGTVHPFLVLQWVDGVPLYDQHRLHPTSPPELRRWLLQLSQAVATLHAQGAVHRDIKGDNVLVRRSDGRAMLMDFGTGLYPGAAPLTPAMGFPGTPIYRSPEAWLFEMQFYRSSTARYRPSAADDLYALGVTACRLLTGEYPEPAVPSRDERGTLHLDSVLLPRALLRHPHVDPALRAITLRLLSVKPEQRGTAAQLAQELEQTLTPFRRHSSTAPSATVRTRARTRFGWRWWALAAASLALVIGTWRVLSSTPPQEGAVTRAEPPVADSVDAGPAGLGDTATPAALEKEPADSTQQDPVADIPEPQPGQIRPDRKGLCPGKGMLTLNGGCWVETTWDAEKCQEFGGEMVKGTCYLPVLLPGKKRPSTSGPTEEP
ncbi:serine/threonine-protein kinase [Hyalangium gracile]|uniref:serine/threonine-protein kinase n=1 Tax=Hyalangium gracile TaxID=394092 RepID=UPI001CCC6AC8|nr:serine/threonine-protein kinase [Hyalangium gracile]